MSRAHPTPPLRGPWRRMAGVSLIELMIGIGIGMLVVAGALSMYLSTRSTYRTTESVSRIQENSRIGFELMAADLRQAAFVPCGSVPVSSALGTPFNVMGPDLFGIQGYNDTTAAPGVAFTGGNPVRAQRAAGTDAVVVGAASTTGFTVSAHDEPNSLLTVNVANHGLAAGDILMVCDNEFATLFQATANTDSTNGNIGHALGGNNPGNARRCLGDTANCAGAANTWKVYDPNSIVTRFESATWYVGCANTVDCTAGNGGRSLFRIPNRLVGAAPEELVTDVDDMQLLYLRDGQTAYAAADPAWSNNDWDDVVAVRITLTLTSPDTFVSTNANVNDGRLTRTVSHTVTLRNRVP